MQGIKIIHVPLTCIAELMAVSCFLYSISYVGDRTMGHETNLDIRTDKPDKEMQPQRDSYDSGYEHSWQHWFAVRERVEDAD